MRTRHALALATVLAVSTLACRDDGPTGLAGAPTDGRVFIDNFVSSNYEAFGGSKLDAVSIVTDVKFRGTSSLKVTIPAASAGYSGGAFVASAPRDLTGYTALTFYARASVAATLNVAGIGNDNTGTSLFTSERNDIALTTAWAKYTIPIPLASKLSAEKGLFYFAESQTVGYDLWLDDIRFENITTITNPRPTLAAAALTTEVGATQRMTGLGVTFAVAGVDQSQTAAAAYFSFVSSNAAVATFNSAGVASILAAGSANVTATLGGTAAVGTVALTAFAAPTAGAPVPTRDSANVISLFSNTYTNRAVNTWSAEWDNADVTDVTIAGNAAKRYANLGYAGVEFTTPPVNATTMTGIHLDVYVNSTTNFYVKLVDWGANAAFGGGDDTEHRVMLTAGTTPGLTAGAWSSLDLPLSMFTGMTGRANIAQMVLEGSSPITYVDNVYFYRVPVPPAPTTAADAPTALAANVISLFSNAYTNVAVDTWSAVWDAADVEDIQIGGNDVKKYTNLTTAGIEFTTTTINASTMSKFHFDFWTPDNTGAPENIKVKLVDFGADNGYLGGDDSEHELTFTAASTPAIATGSWVRFEIPLSAFTGLTNRSNLAQLIISSGPNTVFIDNVYFSTSGLPTAPTTAAPTPTYAAGDVISLFSNAYTDVAVNTFRTGWSVGDLTDLQVATNDVKRYTNLDYVGVEFVGANKINATAMTHFRVDLWTPDDIVGTASVRVKLVDFGADGAYQGGDDREHELIFNASSTPALTAGSWITIDIPLSQFTGLTTRANLSQLIFSGTDALNTLFVDNILLHR